MEFTEEHAKMIRETRDAVLTSVGKVEEHHQTLYGNGQPGLVKDHLKFKTQITTAVAVVSSIFTIVCGLLAWLT